MMRVVIESPYAGDIEKNVRYARACVRDSLLRGEAPIASHLLHTQAGILKDEVPEEREKGIRAGHAWIQKADIVAVYLDLGLSRGMLAGIREASECTVNLSWRTLGGEWPGQKDSLPKCLREMLRLLEEERIDCEGVFAQRIAALGIDLK